MSTVSTTVEQAVDGARPAIPARARLPARPTRGRRSDCRDAPARRRRAAGCSESTVPSTANSHSRSVIAAYSSPPTKTSASRGRAAHARTPATAQAHDEREATEQGLTSLVGGRHRREGDHHHELGEEQHRLGEDQAARVETGVVPVEDVARDDDVAVGQSQEREQRLGVAQDLADDRPRAVVLAHLARLAPAAQQVEPEQHRHHRAGEDARACAISSVGRHTMSAVPITRRGTP